MKEVFVHQDFTRVGFYESVLKDAGIRCFIQNATTHNLLTGLPSPLFFPKLCVIDDEDCEDALALLEPLHSQPLPDASDAKDWTCPKCHESVPSEFGSCWQCGAMREDT